jgi:hypothetical protein
VKNITFPGSNEFSLGKYIVPKFLEEKGNKSLGKA